ncbi:hypothetical protein WDW89_18030 [Deltaproteobacteria bacterium TL4]
MKTIKQSLIRDESLEGRLGRHPQLKKRVEAMLDLIENTDGNIEKANI